MRAALRGPLELRDGSEDVQLEASCRGRRIDAFGQRDKSYAQSLEFIEQQNQVAQVQWIVTKQVPPQGPFPHTRYWRDGSDRTHLLAALDLDGWWTDEGN